MSERPAPDARAVDASPRVFVILTWLLMTAAAFAFVWRYASSVPHFDDWALVPVITGHQPFSLSWLWAPHNEHRLLGSKLFVLATYVATGGSWRAGAFLNVAVLSAITWAVIATTAGVRGAYKYSDAFIALIALNWSQYYNMLVSFQFQVVIDAALVCILVIAAAQPPARRTPLPCVVAGISLLMMPLFGAPDLPFVPPLALWLIVVAPTVTVPAGRTNRALVIALRGLATGSLLLFCVYFYRFSLPTEPMAKAPPRLAIEGAVAALTAGFGSGASTLWPLSGIITASLVAATLVVLSAAVRRAGKVDTRAVGLLLCVIASVVMSLAIGWGRAEAGVPNLINTRYVTLAVPVMVCAYLSWTVYGKGYSGDLVPVGLFMLGTMLLISNDQAGRAFAGLDRQAVLGFKQDLRAGAPLPVLVGRYAYRLLPGPQDRLAQLIQMLRSARVDDFASPVRSQAVLPIRDALTSAAASGATRTAAGWHGYAGSPSLTVTRPKNQYVVSADMHITLLRGAGPAAAVTIFWKNSSQPVFGLDRSYSSDALHWGPGEQVLHIGIGAVIDEMRIDLPPGPCDVRISGIILYVPPPGASGGAPTPGEYRTSRGNSRPTTPVARR